MHNAILGKRNLSAQQRILATSKILAAHFMIDPALVSQLKVQEKDPMVRAMKEREAAADLLEAIQMSLGLSASDPDQAVSEVTVEAVAGESEVEPVESVTGETGDGLPDPVVEDEPAVVPEKKSGKPAGKKAAG